ncbi:hypothetical protein DM01DRAFT_1337312 [Hesseltinella vesiculosa]|uniref:Uncharacterized protein n=1 Tax=Hesseltinella vesiculosa TaxID=101127 RepID=A0A1X2GDC9_9FUNG|nr:hypothetical protein DM01DRAFT_1337312 [Hesseltinella vesiculosa]
MIQLPVYLILSIQRYLLHRSKVRHRAFCFLHHVSKASSFALASTSKPTLRTSSRHHFTGFFDVKRSRSQQRLLSGFGQQRSMASLATPTTSATPSAIQQYSRLWTPSSFSPSSQRFMVTPSTSSPSLQSTANASLPSCSPALPPSPTTPVTTPLSSRHQPQNQAKAREQQEGPATYLQTYHDLTPPMRGFADIIPPVPDFSQVQRQSRLVHRRGQLPSSSTKLDISVSLPRYAPTATTTSASTNDLLVRHDDLSLEPAFSRSTLSARHSRQQRDHPTRERWCLIIPLDITQELVQEHAAAWSSVSLSDPVCLHALHLWVHHAHQHMTRVTQFIQLLTTEATRLPANLKFGIKLHAQSLYVVLPNQLLSASTPLTAHQIQQWIHRISSSSSTPPPTMDIKKLFIPLSPTLTSSMSTFLLPMPATTVSSAAPSFSCTATSSDSQTQAGLPGIQEVEEEDDDLVIVSPILSRPSSPNQHEQQQLHHQTSQQLGDMHNDGEWVIGPRYFQDIHSFLNHVDSMIDSSPAFTGRRFSA